MAELQIETKSDEGVSDVWLLGELDSYSAPRVRELLEALAEQEHAQVRVHMNDLEYIDSTGLGVLVGALKQTADHSGSFVLIDPSPQVSHVLKVTGLNHVFTISAPSTETTASSL